MPDRPDTPSTPVRKEKKDPFGPPLDASELRGVFRRLHARQPVEQIAFVRRLNWNLLDAHAERRTMESLLRFLVSTDTGLQDHAVQTLKKLFHNRRGRYAPLFATALPHLDLPLQLRIREVFGPVLGPEQEAAIKSAADAAPAQPASQDELERLQDFFRRKV